MACIGPRSPLQSAPLSACPRHPCGLQTLSILIAGLLVCRPAEAGSTPEAGNCQSAPGLMLLLWCPQGEQGEDGKAEGPPGLPGVQVSSLSVPLNFSV